jgi:hypothetical protein
MPIKIAMLMANAISKYAKNGIPFMIHGPIKKAGFSNRKRKLPKDSRLLKMPNPWKHRSMIIPVGNFSFFSGVICESFI